MRPRYGASQDEILAWLADAHGRAAAEAAGPGAAFDEGLFHERIRRLIRHVCCGTDRIAMRGHSVPPNADDLRPDERELYQALRAPAGAGTAARTDWFAREAERAFVRLYDGEDYPPDDLLHVTCTGYVSPSAAQRLVAARRWGARTRVTHLYHMGCYAAVPALRIASALVHAASDGRRVDVAHTELCSVHFDPTAHTAEQLVVQSLFADGIIRYSARAEGDGTRALRVLGLHEVLADDSEDAMQWRLGDRGMRMVLSRDVPDHIARAIRPFVTALFAGAGLDFARERADCAFAVHPGGPKIVDIVRDALELREPQVASARRVLRRFGNMSSATLPHIWSDLLDDDSCAAGTLVASVAFGPGLTVCGALFRKV